MSTGTGELAHARVLLIEDDEAYARFVQELFARQRSEVAIEWAPTLREGLSRLESGAGPALSTVLLDLTLPDSDRMRSIQSVLDAAAGTPVVVVTGSDDDDLAADALLAGAQDYLVKGEADRLLVHAVARAITRQRAVQEMLDRRERDRPTLPPQSEDGALDRDDPDGFEVLADRYRRAVGRAAIQRATADSNEARRELAVTLGEMAADLVEAGRSARDAIRIHTAALEAESSEGRPESVGAWVFEGRLAILELSTLIADAYRERLR